MNGSVLLAYATPKSAYDGIYDYCRSVVESLNARAPGSGSLVLRERIWRWHSEADGRPASLATIVAAARPTLIALQYNPFSYARGFAPGLVGELTQLRRSPARIALVVHEPYLNTGSLRMRLLGLGQRAQLQALIGVADDVLVTTDRWRSRLPGNRAGAVLLAVAGSNLPDRRAARTEMKTKLGISGPSIVCVTFGLHLPHQQPDHARKAFAAMCRAGADVVHLNLGSDAVPMSMPGVRALRPGPQPASDLAAMFAAGDIFLGPYADGATTRRTALAAALQHGLAAVATAPRENSAFGENGGLWLTALDDAEAFASAAAQLAVDPGLRARFAEGARALFDERLAWPVAIEPYVRLAA